MTEFEQKMLVIVTKSLQELNGRIETLTGITFESCRRMSIHIELIEKQLAEMNKTIKDKQ